MAETKFRVRDATVTVTQDAISTITTQMPLTTVFTPPNWCTSQPYTYFTEVDGMSTFWRDVDGPGDGTESACFPYSYGYQHNPTVSAEYSPGVCPSGYEGAAVSQDGPTGAATSWCCPRLVGHPYAATMHH